MAYFSGLPAALHQPLTDALASIGDHSGIRRAQPVGGGCINNALCLETTLQRYCLKWNPDPLPHLFAVEADGLRLMAATQTVRVPAVLFVGKRTTEHPAYLLLEWLEGTASSTDPAALARLGEQLAEMHLQRAASYGLAYDNYIGSTPQYNGWYDDWVRFFRERRLQPQIQLAQQNRFLPGDRRQRLERVCERLDDLLAGVARHPALLHGDLWGGNVLPGPDGNLALIDPAVYYGDREADIAYTELFSGFDRRFYAAYTATYPLEPGYTERRDIYNLYHLLNHLNLFGESYGSAIDRITRRFARRS